MVLNEHVICLDSTAGFSNCFLVYDNGWILIDTGLGFLGKRILKELDKRKIKPTEIGHILLTHQDADHTGNLKLLQGLTGATVWAHPNEIPFITGEQDMPGFKKYLGKLNAKNKIQDVQPFRPDMRVGNIKVYFTPGHSPGHVCMLFKDMLFVGDLVENKRGQLNPYPKLWNWDTHMLLASIRSLSTVGFNWVCPAHGKPVMQNRLPAV